MVVISSTTNEWPQRQSTTDEKRSSLTMEKAATINNQEHQHQQQQHPSQLHGLRCPRCDSSNTKFCYYNNYSLSQPRHFCKACKRYWTRGGTLRNVPVGGGCRKNKRVKRQPSSSASLEAATANNNNNNNNNTIHNTASTSTASITTTTNGNPSFSNPSSSSQAQMDMVSSGPNHINPLFFGLPTNPSEMNLPFPARFNPRVSSSSMDGYDHHLQPQLNALGLGFSSSTAPPASTTSSLSVANNGFSSINSLLVPPGYSSIFGSSSPTISTTSPTMATLLASSFHQQKFSVKGDPNKSPFDQFQTLTGQPLEGILQMHGNNGSGNVLKGVKMENRQQLDWSLSYHQNHDQEDEHHHHQLGFSSDPNYNSLYWSSSGGSDTNPSNNPVGAWHDPANLGPSVTSLI